jgi:hypothetical protein
MNKVKLTLILLVTLVSLTTEARGRHRYYRGGYDGMLRTGIHIGVSGSFNSTWILNQNNYNTLDKFSIPIVRQSEMDYVFTWGGQVGVEIGYNFKKSWGIQFEPSFSWAGQKYDDDFSGPVDAVGIKGNFYPTGSYINSQGTLITATPTEYYSPTFGYVNVRREVTFTYVQLPIYAKYQTHIGDIANYYVMLGPQINYRMSGSETVWVKHIVYKDQTNFTPDQKFQKLDVGMSLNTGVEIYAKEWCYLNIGLVAFGSFIDLNGKDLKNLEWYSKNDLKYQESHNFYMGLHLGVHFYLDRQQYY